MSARATWFASLAVMAVVVAAAAGSPWVAPGALHGAPSSAAHLLLALVVASPIGVGLGLLGSLSPGVDTLRRRLREVTLALHVGVLALFVLIDGADPVAWTVVLTRVSALAALTRFALADAARAPWVAGAVALGARPVRTLATHVVPSAFAVLRSEAAWCVPWTLAIEALGGVLGVGNGVGTRLVDPAAPWSERAVAVLGAAAVTLATWRLIAVTEPDACRA